MGERRDALLIVLITAALIAVLMWCAYAEPVYPVEQVEMEQMTDERQSKHGTGGRVMSYIDRNALGIGYADRNLFTDPAYADGWNAAIEILENTPDADVEPIKHGEWIVDTIYPSGVKKFHCSICGQERTVHEKYEGVFRQNYCSNCGARMDKRET